MKTLVLEFKEIERDNETKYSNCLRVILMMYFNQSIARLYKT